MRNEAVRHIKVTTFESSAVRASIAFDQDENFQNKRKSCSGAAERPLTCDACYVPPRYMLRSSSMHATFLLDACCVHPRCVLHTLHREKDGLTSSANCSFVVPLQHSCSAPIHNACDTIDPTMPCHRGYDDPCGPGNTRQLDHCVVLINLCQLVYREVLVCTLSWPQYATTKSRYSGKSIIAVMPESHRPLSRNDEYQDATENTTTSARPPELHSSQVIIATLFRIHKSRSSSR